MSRVRNLGLFALMAGPLWFGCVAQGQIVNEPIALKFDMASIRASATGTPAEPGPVGRAAGGCPQSLRMDRSRVDIKCATLTELIGYAFRFPPDRIAGPEWLMRPGAPRFDIAAMLPQNGSQGQIPEMLQHLLSERFRLVVHQGTTREAVFALTIARGGSNLIPAAAPTPAIAPDGNLGFFGDTQVRAESNAGQGHLVTISGPRMGTVRQTERPKRIQRWEASSITSAGLADLLDKVMPVQSPVVDATRLKGRYQLVLEVSLADLTPASMTGASDPSMMEETVLKGFNDGLRRLGLRLERRRGMVETIVVDHLERTPSEN